jgi:hypothetical protein
MGKKDASFVLCYKQSFSLKGTALNPLILIKTFSFSFCFLFMEINRINETSIYWAKSIIKKPLNIVDHKSGTPRSKRSETICTSRHQNEEHHNKSTLKNVAQLNCLRARTIN